MPEIQIPFNRPYTVGTEFDYIQQAISQGHLSGNGMFTKRCHTWLQEQTRCYQALLTHSCTAALEMAMILADIQPGDEVIMPSYTFVSTANAVVLRGGVPVFIDIRPDTLNLDETLIEQAITPKTKAIAPVHYAGVGCEMDVILEIAQRHQLWVIEDAAQGVMSRYRDRPLGSLGHLAAVSFHETKNVIAGEGGALLVNYAPWCDRAEIIWEKGTNRSQFFRGQVDKYSWVDVGSSFLPSDINAAFLWAQFEQAQEITRKRMQLWQTYHKAFAELETQGIIRRPIIPNHCQHNAHMYYLLLPNLAARKQFIGEMKAQGILAVFHYVPLHTAPFGQKCSHTSGQLKFTEDLSDRLVRLPLWAGMTPGTMQQVIDAAHHILRSL